MQEKEWIFVSKCDFSCDYSCGAAPQILKALAAENGGFNPTYGEDGHTARAIAAIREAVGNPEADVWFLVGGTQTNATLLSALLQPWQGVLCAETGHIAVHEAGAVEATGHKVLPVAAGEQGKVDIDALERWLTDFYADATYPHMVAPGAVYLSQPTEYGGLYSRAELTRIRALCDRYGMALYADGARLAYALAAPANDVTLADLGALCDAFYIGGTKCGALFGEAAVFRRPQPGFFTHRKQHGALLAKGWLLGLQFEVLFTDGLYRRLGQNAIDRAAQLKTVLTARGVEFASDSPTNQQFLLLDDAAVARLREFTAFDVWGRADDGRTVVRVCTSWATTAEDVDALGRVFA